MQKQVSKPIYKENVEYWHFSYVQDLADNINSKMCIFLFFYQFTKNFVQCIMVIVTLFLSLTLPSPFCLPHMLNFVSYFIIQLSKCQFMILILLDVCSSLENGLLTGNNICKENWTSLSKYLSGASSFLCKGEILFSLPYGVQNFVYNEAGQVLCIVLQLL